MTDQAINRRTFLKQSGVAAGCAGAGLLSGGPGTCSARDEARGAKGVALLSDPEDAVANSAPAQWAAGQLRDALAARGVTVRLCKQMSEVAPEEVCVLAGGSAARRSREVLEKAGATAPTRPEALALVPGHTGGRDVLLACGSDARGLTYALLELADCVTDAERPLAGLDLRRPVSERPANTVRSVARLFASNIEDKPWFDDRSFWRQYLTNLAAQRFNRFSLTLGLGYDFTTQIRDAYFHFAYPFFLALPGVNVRAVGLPGAERDKNLEMLRFISGETAARGLQFQLGLWTHAYQWTDSPNANYTIAGLTPATHATYCRDALRTLLHDCPAIGGVTFRVHGESGVAEGSYDFWKTVFDGAARCGRMVGIDLHAKGIDQPLIDAALATGLPVTISPKFWAEHMGLPYHQAAIRPLELPPRGRPDGGFFARSNGSRRFLRYGYGDLLAEDRRYGIVFRIWPGTQRLLLWGDPAMAAGYGRASSFCGCLGVEICEPLSFKGRKGSGRPGHRTGYADSGLHPQAGDWAKYLDTYRLWGRLLYNPDAEPESWRRALRSEYGAAAADAEVALAHASRILPLVTTAHLPSAANNNYWPEIYTNMSIVDARAPHPYGDTPSPKRFGTVSPLDPALFSRVDDYADELLKGEFSGRYSPPEVAQWLQDLAAAAAKRLADAETKADPRNVAFRRLAVDVAIQSGLGQFFAHKLRAGVLYALYERGRDRAALEEALKAYRAARAAWAELARRADGVYVRDLTFGPGPHQRGHWFDRLPAIDQDIERMAKATSSTADAAKGDPAALGRALQMVLAPARRTSMPCQHKQPPPFRPGEDVAIELALGERSDRVRPVSVRLHYRRVHQAEPYQVEEMRGAEGRWRTTIPGSYTRSPYPLQYSFELRDGPGRAWLFPGFAPDLCNQPYYVLRQAQTRAGR
jgi:hypothetical protein